jgi:hypothetical protein
MGRVGVVNRGTGPGVGAVPRLERLSALNSRLWIAPPPPREDSEFQTLGAIEWERRAGEKFRISGLVAGREMRAGTE